MKKQKLEIKAKGASNVYMIGEKGKGGGSQHVAVEATNTLRSADIVRVAEIISEGPIEGIAGGGQGIYINDTPFTNADGSPNFSSAKFDYRVGTPDQDYMPGFSAVESELSVSTDVTIIANNIVRTTSDPKIDAVMVTMQLPQGLTLQNKTNGDLNGSTVTFRIDVRPEGGTYTTAGTYTITGKTTNAYEAQYRIQGPTRTASQRFDVRVTRISPDPTSEQKNQTQWARMTEIQEAKVSYPGAAVVGIAIDAETVGNSIPTRGYLVKGLLYKIPSNLNPDTRVYSGLWDGTFKNTTKAFDNPVWALYDLLTSEKYGAGLDPSEIDAASFYSASVYCDENVPYTNSLGQTVNLPRFTFNTRIADRPEVLELARNIAGAMNGNLIFWNGKWTLTQDRPTNVSKIITKDNTLFDSGFIYKSSGVFERHTAVNMSYNDMYNRYLERVITHEATLANGYDFNYVDKDKYGYNSTELIAFGATTEGQAIRAAKWALDTELNSTELVEFDMSINGFDLMPGDVVGVFDEDTANVSGAGKLVSSNGTNVVLDRAVDLTPGSHISVLLADGKTIEDRAISNSSGRQNVLTIASPFSQNTFDQADFFITSAINVKPFRVINVTCPETDRVHVEAVFYDETKWARVEQGIILPKKIFANDLVTVVGPPDTITFAVESGLLVNGISHRQLVVKWHPPANSTVAGYVVSYDLDNGNKVALDVQQNYVSIPADQDGTYRFTVFSRDYNGNLSGTAATAAYTLTVGQGATSTLNPVTNLGVRGVGGTLWPADDLNIQWTNPASNDAIPGVTTRDFKVSVYNGAVKLHEEYVAGVPAGSTQYYTYSYTQNLLDGGPRQTLSVRVQIRDSSANLSAETAATFSAAVPSTVTNLKVRGGSGTVFTVLDPEFEWTSVNGAGVSYINDSNFAYFQVNVYNGATLSRQVQTYTNNFQYLFSDNVRDNGQDNPNAAIRIEVAFVNRLGGISATTSQTFTPIAPPAVTNLFVKGTTGLIFNQTDLNVTWLANDTAGKAFSASNMFKKFKVVALNGSTALREESTPAEFYSYTLDKNTQDNANVPIRNPILQVTAVNVYNVSSAAVSGLFSNPPPQIPSNLNIISGIGNYKVTFDKPVETDYVGTYVWQSTTSNFTPSAANLVADMAGAYQAINAPSGITYYVKIASYDYFGIGAKDGVGLNVSAQASVAATSAGIPKNDTAPAGVEGDIYVNTTDGKLYRYHNGAWVANVSSGDIAGTIADAQIASVSASKLNGQVIDAQIASLTAGKVTGKIVGTQIADNSISTPLLQAGSVNTSKLTIIPEGMIPDPYFNDLSFWGTYVQDPGWYFETRVNGAANIASLMDVPRGAALSMSAIGTARQHIWNKAIPFSGAGQTLRFRAKMYNGSTKQTLIVAIRFTNADGSVTDQNLSTGPNVGYNYASIQVPVPNGTISYMLIIYNTGGVADTGYMGASELKLDVASDASLIVDGAIIASKLSANSVVAGKIDADAVEARNIKAGAITVDKLLVTSQGNAINPDPALEDMTAWYLTNGMEVLHGSQAPGSTGGTHFSAVGVRDAMAYSRQRFAVDPQKVYKLSAKIYSSDQATSNAYVFVNFFDFNGNKVEYTQTGWGGTMSGYTFGGVPTPVNVFNECGAQFGAGTARPIPGIVRTAEIGVWLQYSGNGNGAGQQAVQDIRLERVNDGSLVVDGTITATKMAANSIAAVNIQADAITSVKILASSISTDKLAANAVTVDKLAANSVTADKIQAGAITADKILAGSITADRIDTRGLAIKDVNGRVLLGSGVGLPIDYVPAGALNSNVTPALINAIGAGNPLTAGNISTYIAAAAIDQAYIGTISASKIDTRGLTIKDNAGNVILNAGQSLATQVSNAVLVNPNLAPTPQGFIPYSSSLNRNGDPRFGDGQYIYIPTGPEGQYYGANSPALNIAANSYYTVSFSAYCEGNPRVLNVDVFGTGYDSVGTSVQLTNVQTNYQFSETMMNNGNAPACYLRIFCVSAGGSNIVVSNVKVELGLTKTPWTDSIITPTNASTFIQSAAINDAQIGYLNVNKVRAGSLDALSANVGLLRTAASGGRTEIYANVIKVFSDNNSIAVQIGNLNA